MNAPAKVAKHKPAVCTGLTGKRCTCGLIHTPGGRAVDTEEELSSVAQAIVGAVALMCAGLAILAALLN